MFKLFASMLSNLASKQVRMRSRFIRSEGEYLKTLNNDT
jgi:hypothetical protein